MSIKSLEGRITEFLPGINGVNLYLSAHDLKPGDAMYSKNMIYENGMRKIRGSTKFETDEVAADLAITGLHKFYFGDGNRQLMVSSGTVVKYHDGTTWQDIKTGLTTSLQTHMASWGALGKTYIGNGVDTPHSWDSTTSANIAGANFPQKAVMFLPYQDRLLVIDNNDLGTLNWSESFSDSAWEGSAATGVKPDSKLFGMIHHGSTNIDDGYEGKVLVAGANGMYLFSGTDMDVSSGNYTIHPLAMKIGCNAPRTMVWTPKGSIYLGIDRQIYLLPFDSIQPISIGNKISSRQITGSFRNPGIEVLTSGNMPLASAVYHDGYYILSFAKFGIFNNVQWFLDIGRLGKDDSGLFGPWYGPMEGVNVGPMISQTGDGDVGELLAGEASSAIGSFVYTLDETEVFGHSGVAIDIDYQTYFDALGSFGIDKTIREVELEILNTTESITVDFMETDGIIGINKAAIPALVLNKWGQVNWGARNWNNFNPTRIKANVDPEFLVRLLSLRIKSSSATQDFILFRARVLSNEEGVEFGI